MAKGRRVRRIVRRIDTWSVLRVSALFNVSLGIIALLAGILLWMAGSATGAVENIEGFMQAIGFDDFRFVPSQIFRGAVTFGVVGVLFGTAFTVVLAALYNLIADVVGGIEFSVLEEAPAVRPVGSEPAEREEIDVRDTGARDLEPEQVDVRDERTQDFPLSQTA